ncbi:MAG TPA: C4-dicarboxylate ABC transporter substrate-binding protein, partial [Succinivibrionaceae bacterium]|nr:C4-dicarboxylate ABC transporter substrate-binding protein [Succinivibrionaceae bacterium]
MKKFAIALCALGVAVACGTVSAADYPSMKIRAATANIEASHHGICLNKVKEIVEKESGGKIKMEIFYGGSLGDEQANVKQLRNNEIQMSTLTGNNLVAFAPSAGVFTLPYIFPTAQDARKVFDSDVAKDINETIAKESGTRPLHW